MKEQNRTPKRQAKKNKRKKEVTGMLFLVLCQITSNSTAKKKEVRHRKKLRAKNRKLTKCATGFVLAQFFFFFYPHLARRNSVLALRTLPVLSATHLSTGWSSLSSALFSSMALMDDENTKISYPFCTTIRQMCEQAKMCAQKTTKRKTAFLF